MVGFGNRSIEIQPNSTDRRRLLSLCREEKTPFFGFCGITDFGLTAETDEESSTGRRNQGLLFYLSVIFVFCALAPPAADLELNHTKAPTRRELGENVFLPRVVADSDFPNNCRVGLEVAVVGISCF